MIKEMKIETSRLIIRPYIDDDFKYSFAIFLKDTGRFIGWCGVGILDCFYPDKEIYYLIGQDHWGNGYATEAMTALIEYCFNTIKLEKMIALAKPENMESNKVIQKIGFKFRYLVSGLPDEFDFYNGEPYYSLTA